MRLKYRLLLAITGIVVGLDQLTKFLITEKMHLGQTFDVIRGAFAISYVRNTGAAFGFMAHADPVIRVPFFIAIPSGALLAIAFVFRKIRDNDVLLSGSLSLVIGGAIGNLMDRLRLGYVVDFLDFHWKYEYHFPAFNFADAAICIGVAALMVDLVVPRESENYASASR